MQTAHSTLERKFFTWLAGGVAVALLIVTGLVAYALLQSWRQYIAGAKDASTTIAALLQANLHATLRDVDLTLRRAEVEFRNMQEQRRFSDAAFSTYLRSLKERIPDTESIRGSNAQGQVIYGEGIDAQNLVVLTNGTEGDDLFDHARNAHELVFGLPIKSKISGQWVLRVARALRSSDESFAGMVYVNIKIDSITDMFAALSNGTHGSISLFDHERRVLSHSAATGAAKTGGPISTFPLEPGMAGTLFTGQPVAAFQTEGAGDERDSIVKLNAIAPYPVYVAVSLHVDDILANWRQRARTTVASVLVLYGLSGLLLLAVRRAMHRQQLAQDQAQRQTELLDEVINQLPFGVLAYDAQHSLQLSNRIVSSLMKYPPDLLQRRPLHFSEVVRYAYARGDYGFDDPLDVVVQRFHHIMATHQTVLLERHLADGRYIEFRAMPIASDWTLITYTDISDHKASEQSLLLARQAADAANQVKSNFLATMSHEIRTPMNGVLGMLKLLQHTELSPRQLDYTRKAEGATHALLGIINDILDFSKVEAGKLELHIEPVVLGDLMRDLSDILSSNVAHKDVEVLFAVAPDVPPALLCDGLRLRQVLLNMAGNAVKFTERGEVVLGINVRARHGDQVELEFSVRDTGIGIPPDKLEHIFEAFSQAESSTTRRFGGSGLGLAICKQLVQMMGGTLAVDSVLGKGSRFYFSAPFTVAANPAASSPPGQRLRVMIVDDNALARSLLQEMAVSMGWQVEALASGQAALDRLAQDGCPEFDLVLMDWRMPEMDGWEATRNIRRLQHGGNAPVVIMVTAAGREMLAQKTKAETDLLDGYLVKPITASMLYEAVVDAIHERSGERPRQLLQPADQRLRGLRLLLVEDNLMNQQIAQELLESNGAQVDIAVCGVDGVAKALAAVPHFDAILMDMQMPDIDGLEATHRIRSHVPMLTVPIIAMTANAMQADKQACLDAGMVDHIAKPFDLEHLVATILRHTAGHDLAPGHVATAAPGNATPSSLHLDTRAAIARMGGSRAFYDKVLVSFRKEAAEQWSELQAGFAQSKLQGAAHNAHTLKGLAATVGAIDLSRHAAEFETMLQTWHDGAHGDATAAAATLAEKLQVLAQTFAQTLDALDRLDDLPQAIAD